jgi:hypothetical protein
MRRNLSQRVVVASGCFDVDQAAARFLLPSRDKNEGSATSMRPGHDAGGGYTLVVRFPTDESDQCPGFPHFLTADSGSIRLSLTTSTLPDRGRA